MLNHPSSMMRLMTEDGIKNEFNTKGEYMKEKMLKQSYEAAELEITKFELSDVIATSDPKWGDGVSDSGWTD